MANRTGSNKTFFCISGWCGRPILHSSRRVAGDGGRLDEVLDARRQRQGRRGRSKKERNAR